MAIANYFYNETTRKYVALFGTLFNQLKIERKDNAGNLVQSMIVPISYAPFQKVLARVAQDPDLLNSRTQSIRLPRMSFEITSLLYDPVRKVNSTTKIRKSSAESSGSRAFQYAPVPYNIDFSLYIMTKYQEDATKIMEQIIPFFTPDWTASVKMIADMDPLDIPIILNSVTTEDLYEGDFETRQSILYTLNFTLKGYYFGPEKKKKVIKFIDIGVATGTLANTAPEERITIQPGLDSNGDPVYELGETATATAEITLGQVSAINITDDGQIYNANNVITVDISSPSTVDAVISSLITGTSISAINVDTGGGYYSSVPAITINEPDSPVTTATASAVTGAGGAIDSFTVTEPGTYYNSATVTIPDPPAKSPYIKFGDDALYFEADTDEVLIHTMATNLITAGQGFAVEFWIYPEEVPASGVHNVIHWNTTTMRIEIEPDSEIVYRPNFNSPPIRCTPEVLNLNQWNHVRLEHFGGTARWLINGVVDQGGNAPQGFILGGGVEVIAGQRGATPAFKGAIDNVIIDQITGLTAVGSYTVPTTAQTGSDFTGDFEKETATATVQVADGVVTGLTVVAPGANYNANTIITITDPNGTPADFQASATAVLTDGTVTAVNITNPGKFYLTANTTIDPAAAITATASATVSPSGDISAINITNPGAGYSTAPTVTIAAPASANTIPYQQVEFDDDWGIITIIEDI